MVINISPTKHKLMSLLLDAVTHESGNFCGDTPKNETAQKLKVSRFTDFDKRRVYIGVIDPLESRHDLIFELHLLLHCHFGYSCQKLEKI